jgi:glycosyltransferase involved in cell wall biosynthesis
MDATDISVAVIEQSERSENLINPLKASAMDVTIDPSDPYSRDIVIVDTPDREMAKEVLKKPFHSSKLVFRMRGDPFFGIDEWINSKLKEWLALNVVIPGVDGCITITPAHADLFERETGVPAGVAELPAYPDRWPNTDHTDSELRILTLTNPVYKPKIQPLIDAAPVVNDVLADVGGHWRIGGRGNYEDLLDVKTREYDHVSFDGYLDAYEALDWANCMVHYSNLDGWPNAILEGMSSQLPVLTNDHHAFTDKHRPNTVCRNHDALASELRRYTDPERRQSHGDVGEQYVRDEHSDEQIATEYVSYCKRLLTDDLPARPTQERHSVDQRQPVATHDR